MALEIELKVSVPDPQILRSTLTHCYGPPIKIHKKDSYYRYKNEEIPHAIRLRTQNEIFIVTLKIRKLIEGIEQNIEHEFSVDNPSEFEKFIKVLGFTLHYRKEKFVEVFRNTEKNLLYELSLIPALGWYLEIETLQDTDKDIISARMLILFALKELGFSESQIEKVSYRTLLGY